MRVVIVILPFGQPVQSPEDRECVENVWEVSRVTLITIDFSGLMDSSILHSLGGLILSKYFF